MRLDKQTARRSVKRYMADNDIKFYTIDGVKIGKEIGLGSTNQHCSAVCILQTGQHHSCC